MAADPPNWEVPTVQGAGASLEERLCLLVIQGEEARKHALPPTGRITVGRSQNAEVRIEHPGISRQHFHLHMGRIVRLEDARSRNGVIVHGVRVGAGESVELKPGDVIEADSVILVLQLVPSGSAPKRRLWNHSYFEARLDEECLRAGNAGVEFAVVRLRFDGPRSKVGHEDALAEALGPSDVLAAYGPVADFEILLPAASRAQADERLQRIVERLRLEPPLTVRTGVAHYPRDGHGGDALIEHACAQLNRKDAAPPDDLVVIEEGPMKALWELVRRVAPSPLSVLLIGETGVGKERFAEALHRHSPRADKQLVRLNCAGFSSTLLESELFGHERGAFTGATQSKLGLLEAANGGTVLFDEIGELPLDLQAKLLRVLEERQIRRVGGLKSVPLDVRFVAATNRDLAGDVEKGRFRQDLFFRLNGVTLTIPPLRERLSEIAPLARAFVDLACRQMAIPHSIALTGEAVERLEGYEWPGNIRELRNVIERAVVLCGDGPIDVEHLPVEKMREVQGAPSAAALPVGAGDDDERNRILDALTEAAGNQKAAAKLLGISRATLIRRLAAHSIPRPRKG